MLWNRVIPFILAIESHEVAVIEYDHLRKFIQVRVDDAQKAIERFRSFIQKIDIEHLKSGSGMDSFEKECKNVERLLFDIAMYLFDYRIELMNDLLGNVFEKRVPADNLLILTSKLSRKWPRGKACKQNPKDETNPKM